MKALHRYMSYSRGDHFEMPWKPLEIPVYSRKFNRDKIILFVGDIKTNLHFLFFFHFV